MKYCKDIEKNFIEVSLTYNIILFSGVQHNSIFFVWKACYEIMLVSQWFINL